MFSTGHYLILSVDHDYLSPDMYCYEYEVVATQCIDDVLVCFHLLMTYPTWVDLDQKLLNCDLNRVDLTLQLLRLACNHARRDNRPRDITSTTKSCLGWHKDVWNVLLGVSDRQHHNYLRKLIS